MALRREDLTPEQLVLQEGLDRSWADVQLVLADEATVRFIREQIERLDKEPPVPTLSSEEFDALADRLVAPLDVPGDALGPIPTRSWIPAP